MGLYRVTVRKDKGKIYYLIRHVETQHICVLPTKYLKYKTKIKRSPNTVRNIAFSLVYYMEYLYSKRLEIEEVFELSYLEQMEVFQGFLFWIKSRKHVPEEKGKLAENSTCNMYLRNVFGFYEFLELIEKQFGELSVLTEKEFSCTNAIGNRITKVHRSFDGYLKVYANKGSSIDNSSVVKLLGACTNCRDQLLLILLAETGFRIGELLGIYMVEDIDYEKRRIKAYFREDNENGARGKCEEYRWAVVSTETMELLQFYLSEYHELLKESQYLFITLSGKNRGKAMKKGAVDAILNRLQMKTEIKINTRMLRSYFAKERWRNGWRLETISRALGHRNLETTLRYIDINNEDLYWATETFYKTCCAGQECVFDFVIGGHPIRL